MAFEGSTEGSVSSCSLARTSSSEATSDFAHPSGTREARAVLAVVLSLYASAASGQPALIENA